PHPRWSASSRSRTSRGPRCDSPPAAGCTSTTARARCSKGRGTGRRTTGTRPRAPGGSPSSSTSSRTPTRQGTSRTPTWAAARAEGLVALGHEVTLFATADSRTAARLHAEAPRGYEEDPGGYDVKVVEGLHIAAAFERAGRFDLLSNQFDFLPLTYSRLVS